METSSMSLKFLESRDAEEYLSKNYGINRASGWLASLRRRAGGPKFVYFGRTPYYRISELDAWMRDVASKSQTKSRKAKR